MTSNNSSSRSNKVFYDTKLSNLGESTFSEGDICNYCCLLDWGCDCYLLFLRDDGGTFIVSLLLKEFLADGGGIGCWPLNLKS